MAVTTGSYDPALEDLIRAPIQHLFEVMVYPATGASYPLAVENELSVSFSLAWSPYAQATLKVKTPADPTQRAALDGRLKTYINIELGYAYEGKTSIYGAVKLRIRDVDEDLLAGTMAITLQGREMEPQDADWYADWNGGIPRAGIKECLEYVLAQSLNGPVTISGIGAGYRPDLVDDLNPNDGQDIWSVASSVANSAGLKLYHNGGSQWIISPRATLSNTYAHMLRTGKTGTITAITRKLSRTQWANRVKLIYPDVIVPAFNRPLQAYASISSGPYTPAAVGSKGHTQSIEGWTTQAGATARATALLGVLSARGYSYTIQAAAAYWIRPGMTVPVKTGTGPYERQVVESVTFQPLTGLMSIETIKNEDVI